jgi:RecA DNA recombination protein
MATSTESLPPPGWDREGLDGLLKAFPEGRLSEIVGPRSSGGGSLLLALLARAASRGGLVALVDGADAFDPETAARAGLDLSALLWVRCGGRLPPAWSAADLLARCPGFAAVALDLGTAPAAAPPSFGVRLQRAAEGTPAVVVIRAPRHLTGSAAALVVSVRRVRARWIGAPRRIRLGGLVSEARVLRSRVDPRLAVPGRAWLIEWRA